LTSRVQEPDESDWKKLIRLLKYVNGTRSLGITIEPGNAIEINASVDASFGAHGDGKSHTGVIIALGNGPVYAKSSKQKLVSKSSTEAELIALSDGCTQVIGCRNFLIEQGEVVGPATVFQDNKSTLQMIKNGMSTSNRTKHVNIRFFWVKDRVDAGEIKLVHKHTKEMLADILTKPLQGEQFIALRNKMLNWKF
jgi:hypothetical protein